MKTPDLLSVNAAMPHRSSWNACDLELLILGTCLSIVRSPPPRDDASGRHHHRVQRPRRRHGPAGTIAGDYLDASNVYHGYVRAPDGAITKIDVPGAGTGPFQGTTPTTRRTRSRDTTLTRAAWPTASYEYPAARATTTIRVASTTKRQ